MLNYLLIYSPPAACLFWLLIYCLMASRTSTFKTLCGALLMASIYLYADGSYLSPEVSYTILNNVSLAAQISAPCVLPLIFIYLYQIRTRSQLKLHHLVWIVIPAILFTAQFMLSTLAGEENVEQFLDLLYSEGMDMAKEYKGTILYTYFIWAIPVFRVTILAESVFVIIDALNWYIKKKYSIGNYFRFLFRHERIDMLELQYANMLPIILVGTLKVLLYRDFMLQHPWIAPTISVLLTLSLIPFVFTGLFSEKQTITLHEMKNGFRFNFNKTNKDEIVEDMITDLIEDAEEAALRRIQDRIGRSINIEQIASQDTIQEPALAMNIFHAVARSWDEDSLLARFENLMLHEQLFLQPGLTLVEVADRLNSNKTYVSKMVNNSYNLAFPDLINTLRVDYAEQYIVNNREAKQAEIATACGFPSASSFNNIFKKITGMTPKIWLATYDRQNLGSR